MSNARKLSNIMIGTKVRLTNVDSDLGNIISDFKTRLDSDDERIQAARTLVVTNTSGSAMKDSDLKVVSDLRNDLDSESISVKNLTLSYVNYEYTATAGQTTFTGSDANSNTLAYTADTIQVFLNGVKLDHYDYTATSGTSVVLTEPAGLNHQLLIIVPSIKSTYTPAAGGAHDWSSTPTSTQAIQPSNIANNDGFGVDVDIDRNYAIIGAQGRDDGVNESVGGAYVYYKSGGTWSQQTFLQGPASANVYMGSGVAIGGTTEGKRIAIGGYAYNSSAGLVRWYERSGTSWSNVSGNVSGNTSSNFGDKIRMSGDTTVVGAYKDDVTGSDAGRVWVFTGAGTAQANFTSSDIAAGDEFGIGIDIDGDLLVVGAHKKPEGGTRHGAAYIFERSGTTWTQKAKLNHSDQGTNDRFGTSVACYEGDDGTNTIAVGCLKASNTGGAPDAAGAVYVFTGSGTSYTLQQKLTASDAAEGDRFGNRSGNDISIDKSDGNTLFIAAQQDDDNSLTSSGSVYVFNRSGSTWSQSYKLNQFTIGPSASAFFGNSVSADQHGSLIVGASNEDEGGTARGASYIFDAQ